MENTYSQKYLQRRRFFTVLPLLTVPFITIIFWLMGGGTGTNTTGKKNNGLNLQLPESQLKNEHSPDKLAFYQAADADSVKRIQQMQDDPYLRDTANQPKQKAVSTSRGLNPLLHRSNPDVDEQRINNKIAELQRRVEQPAYGQSSTRSKDQPFPGDIEHQQQLMQSLPKKESDPEMDQINGTLEKILDIQHPDRVKERSSQKRTSVFRVNCSLNKVDNTFLGSNDTAQKKEVFFNDLTNKSENEENSIAAVIHDSQILQQGSVVKLRLIPDIYVNGQLIEAGSFIYGVASIENDRLTIHVTSIRKGNSVFPVAISVYDIDGIRGIYAPGSINREVTKQSTDGALQSMQLLSLDNSIKGQVTAAGLGAAKSLLSKKVKLERITVKAGYKVLLHNDNQQND